MITGMTHNENGEPIKIVKYKGKISTGYAPKEPPNTENHPVACGFFRMMKEIVKNQRIGTAQKIVAIKDWVINEEVQKKIEAACNNTPQPRRVEIYCLDPLPESQWESYLAKYSSTDGLLCKSHGRGTVAKYLTISGDKRKWEDRFADKGGCPFEDCPDFKDGKCKQMGLMKCYPTVDLSPNPYRFETRSINTIIGFESSFLNLSTLSKAAHMVKQMEAGKQLAYDGIFGAKLFLVHRKIKSGGRDVFITDLMPTPEYVETIMEPIRRGLAAKSKLARLSGAAGSLSMLGEASEQMLEASQTALISDQVESAVPVSLDDEKDIAVNFSADAGDEDVSGAATAVAESSVPEDMSKKATETLLTEGAPKK